VAAKKAEAAAAAERAGGGGLPEGLQLQDPSVLLAPGAKDGQTIVVREGGAGVAYAWDAAK
jgi:phospholipase A-2-activating protein